MQMAVLCVKRSNPVVGDSVVEAAKVRSLEDQLEIVNLQVRG